MSQPSFSKNRLFCVYHLRARVNNKLQLREICTRNNGSLSTVVGDEKLTSREDLIGLLFFYVQSDEDMFLKVDEVSKTEAQSFDIFNQLVSSFWQ